MSYPPPPPPAVPGKSGLRGRIPLRLAIIFLVLGIAGIVVGGVIAVNGALKKVDSFTRITVPAAGSVNSKNITFNGTGGYIVYYESRNADSSGIPAIPVRLTSPSGKQQVLETPYGGRSGGKNVKSLSYDYNGHKGVALWQFNVPSRGTYKIEVAGNSRADSDAKIAIGRSIGKSTVIGAVLIVLGVLLLIAGIVLLIVGLVKRSHSKKELAAAQAYYAQSGGYYGGPPGPQQYGGGAPPAYGPPPQYGAPPPPPGQWPPQEPER